MIKVLQVLALNLYMITFVSGAELLKLPSDIHESIMGMLSPWDLRQLEMTGDRILRAKLYVVQRDVSQRVVEKLTPEVKELYKVLPIESGEMLGKDTRSIYHLITYADELLEQRFFQRNYFIELLISFGNKKAIEMKVNGLSCESYGYDLDLTAANNLLEEQVKSRLQWAIEMKLEGLLEGKYGYNKDLTAAKEFIGQQVVLGNQWAIDKKFDWTYEDRCRQDPVAAKKFIDQQVSLGKQWAIIRMWVGLLFGHEKDLTPPKEFLDQQAALGNQWAIEMKVDGLLDGLYGYDSDLTALKEFIDQQVVLGNQWVIEKKLDGLLEIKYGHTGSLTESQHFVRSYYGIKLI